jgi:predicted DNA-binding protein
MSDPRTKPRTIRLSDEEYEKAKKLAEALTRGKVSILISMLINEKYREVFGHE